MRSPTLRGTPNPLRSCTISTTAEATEVGVNPFYPRESKNKTVDRWRFLIRIQSCPALQREQTFPNPSRARLPCITRRATRSAKASSSRRELCSAVSPWPIGARGRGASGPRGTASWAGPGAPSPCVEHGRSAVYIRADYFLCADSGVGRCEGPGPSQRSRSLRPASAAASAVFRTSQGGRRCPRCDPPRQRRVIGGGRLLEPRPPRSGGAWVRSRLFVLGATAKEGA